MTLRSINPARPTESDYIRQNYVQCSPMKVWGKIPLSTRRESNASESQPPLLRRTKQSLIRTPENWEAFLIFRINKSRNSSTEGAHTAASRTALYFGGQKKRVIIVKKCRIPCPFWSCCIIGLKPLFIRDIWLPLYNEQWETMWMTTHKSERPCNSTLNPFRCAVIGCIWEHSWCMSVQEEMKVQKTSPILEIEISFWTHIFEQCVILPPFWQTATVTVEKKKSEWVSSSYAAFIL